MVEVDDAVVSANLNGRHGSGRAPDEVTDAGLAYRVDAAAGEIFETLLEAKILVEDYRIDYNNYRPHSSLGYLSRKQFAEEWARQRPRQGRV